MIGHIWMIVIFQSHHVGHKCVHGDLKCLQQVSLLEKQKQSWFNVRIYVYNLNCHQTNKKTTTVSGLMAHTWKMAYMMQVRGRLWEYSETVKMFRPHLLRSSSSLDSSSSLSVLTPKREMLLLESDGPWETFLTPLICVISCCFCCFFFSRVLDVGEGISTSFCLSKGGENKRYVSVGSLRVWVLIFFCIQIMFKAKAA